MWSDIRWNVERQTALAGWMSVSVWPRVSWTRRAHCRLSSIVSAIDRLPHDTNVRPAPQKWNTILTTTSHIHTQHRSDRVIDRTRGHRPLQAAPDSLSSLRCLASHSHRPRSSAMSRAVLNRLLSSAVSPTRLTRPLAQHTQVSARLQQIRRAPVAKASANLILFVIRLCLLRCLVPSHSAVSFASPGPHSVMQSSR